MLTDAMSLPWWHPETVWSATALVCALAVPLTLALGRFDRRVLEGDGVWRKPFKFALALAIHYATFAVIAHFLPSPEREGVWMAVTAITSSLLGLAELAYISLQAGRARHSHFNGQTRWESVASILMGVGALFVVFPAFFVGIVLVRFAPHDWPQGVAGSTAAALLSGGFLTLITAMWMGVKASRFADARLATGRKMWFTGWALDRADLRVAHFLATHMMQLVPLASLLVAWLAPRAAVAAIDTGLAALWVAFTLYVFRETVKGRSINDILKGSLQASY